MSESWNCRDHDDTIKEHVKDRVKVTHAAIAAKHLAAVGTLTPQTPLSCTLWLVMTFHRANCKKTGTAWTMFQYRQARIHKCGGMLKTVSIDRTRPPRITVCPLRKPWNRIDHVVARSRQD